MKAKDVSKLTKEEALKKLGELSKSLLELEPTSQKRKSIRKAIARLNTYLAALEKGKAKPAEKKEAKK